MERRSRWRNVQRFYLAISGIGLIPWLFVMIGSRFELTEFSANSFAFFGMSVSIHASISFTLSWIGYMTHRESFILVAILLNLCLFFLFAFGELDSILSAIPGYLFAVGNFILHSVLTKST
ncbi:MAG: hypothetical protein JXK92_00390 [Erysipelotrichaceae bacterium]|jgi:hypothetical protein|nr:hypothetical protein [Erysipelotrichaceae bacterium]